MKQFVAESKHSLEKKARKSQEKQKMKLKEVGYGKRKETFRKREVLYLILIIHAF